MKVFVNDEHLHHQAQMELVPGQMVPTIETIDRVQVVETALRGCDVWQITNAPAATRTALASVHTEPFLDFLKTAWAEWSAAFDPALDGIAFVWPNRHLFQKCPESIEGKLGYYSFDGVSPITRNMWKASTGAAGTALAAAKAIQSGDHCSFALCRPPGHHAGPDLIGGTSYLNNTALAAACLANEGARVAIVDVDAHHGNGTQAIFWHRNDVMTVSLHSDPARDYPYFSGFADEVGEGDGHGYNHNFPLSGDADWGIYSQAFQKAIKEVEAFAPDYLVVALGIDGNVKDPVGKLALQNHDFSSMGKQLAQLGLPTAVVFEGGYAIEELGECVTNFLTPFVANYR